MLLISRNTSINLYDKVETLAHEPHESWRCIYVKMRPSANHRRNQQLHQNFVINAIVEKTANNEGSIFLCEDGDIMILFQGSMKKIIYKLATHFGDIQPELLLTTYSDDMFRLFDLSKSTHWDAFINLAEKKYLSTVAFYEEIRHRVSNQNYFASSVSQKSHVNT